MISVIMPTYRPGGLDYFVNSFTSLPADADYELVVVDDYPGRVKRGLAQEFLRSKGVKLGWYGGSKPKSYLTTKCGYANAVNTAVIHARGDYIVHVCDYTALPSDWYVCWTKIRELSRAPELENKVLVSGTAIVYAAEKPTAPDDVYTWQGPSGISPKWPWVPYEFETFYYGAPIEWFEAINGVDELSDHCISWNLSSLTAQVRELGYRRGVENLLCCHMIDHRVWDNEKEEPSPWGIDGMWKITGHSRSMVDIPEWKCPSPNPFDLKKLRREYLNS